MKAMLAAFAAVIILAVAADFALDYAGYASEDRLSGQAVRVN